MKILGYEVERKKVKNINLRIRPDGSIYISAPMNIDDSYIENFIISKKEWIDRNIKRIDTIKKINKNIDLYTEGSNIKYLSKVYTLKFEKNDSQEISLVDNFLIIKSNNFNEENVKQLIYNKLYYPTAKKIFNEKLEYYLALTDEVNDIKLKIGSLKGKWGVCIPKKREIGFSIELIKKSILEIESVVIHEVAHLKYPNHSKNFYNYIALFFSDYKQVNKKLNSSI